MATQPFQLPPLPVPGSPAPGGTIADAPRIQDSGLGIPSRMPETEPEPEPDDRGNLLADWTTGEYYLAREGSIYDQARVLGRSDRTTGQREMMQRYYHVVVDALGLSPRDNPGSFTNSSQPQPSTLSHEADAGFFGWSRIDQELAILNKLKERRRQDPDFLKGVPDTYDEFHTWMVQQEQRSRSQARRTIDASEGIGATLSMLGGFLVEGGSDPANVAAMPLGGGGRTILQIGARSAIASGVVETVLQPSIALNRAAIGERLSVPEALANVGIATVGGGILGAGTAGAARGTGALYDMGIERVFNVLPAAVQERWASRMTLQAAGPDGRPRSVTVSEFLNRLPERDAADFARDVLGPDMTPDQRAAVSVLERDADIREGSPFVRTPEGDDAHAERLSDALRRLIDNAPDRPEPSTAGMFGPLESPRASAAASSGAGNAAERRVVRNGKLRIYAEGERTPVADAEAIAREVHPGVTITQQRRDPDSSLGRRNPGSWHNRSAAAIDVAPIRGMTFEQYVDGFRQRGYTIIEALDETGAGKSAHATGDHWHLVLGEPVGGGAPARAASFDTMWSAIIANEGGTDAQGRFLTSPKGAVGPAQVMPGTAPEAARLAGLPWDEARYRSDADYNIAIGQAYFRKQLEDFGDPLKAAAAYNGGPGYVRGLIRRHGEDWRSHLNAETRKYVDDFEAQTGRGGTTGEPPARALDLGADDDAAARAQINRLRDEAAGMEGPSVRLGADPMEDAIGALRSAADEIEEPSVRPDLLDMFDRRSAEMARLAEVDEALPPGAAERLASASPDQRARIEASVREEWERVRAEGGEAGVPRAAADETRVSRIEDGAPEAPRDGLGRFRTPDLEPGQVLPQGVVLDAGRPLPSQAGPFERLTMDRADRIGMARMVDFLAERLGTRRWVVAGRLTPRLKDKGYDLAVPESRLRELQAEWADNVWRTAADAAPSGAPSASLMAREEMRAFDGIDSAGLRELGDSLEHDLRAAVEAGDSLGSFRLGDEGEEVSARALLDEINADVERAAAMRNCL